MGAFLSKKLVLGEFLSKKYRIFLEVYFCNFFIEILRLSIGVYRREKIFP